MVPPSGSSRQLNAGGMGLVGGYVILLAKLPQLVQHLLVGGELLKLAGSSYHRGAFVEVLKPLQDLSKDDCVSLWKEGRLVGAGGELNCTPQLRRVGHSKRRH